MASSQPLSPPLQQVGPVGTQQPTSWDTVKFWPWPWLVGSQRQAQAKALRSTGAKRLRQCKLLYSGWAKVRYPGPRATGGKRARPPR